MIKLSSLRWSPVQLINLLIKRENLDTEIHVQREDNVKIEGECHVQIGTMLLQTEALSETGKEIWNQPSLVPSGGV